MRAAAVRRGTSRPRLEPSPLLFEEVAGRFPGEAMFPEWEYPHPSPYLDLDLALPAQNEELQDDLESGWTRWPATWPFGGRPFGLHYQEMLYKDPDLASFVKAQQDEVVDGEWRFTPGSAAPDALRIRDFTEVSLAEVGWKESLIRNLSRAAPEGFACVELVWHEYGEWQGAWGLRHALFKPMWHFGFLRSPGGPVFCYRAADGRLIPPPPAKFLWITFGGGESPWGSAYLDLAVKPWYRKLYSEYWEDDEKENYARPAAGCGFERLPGDGEEVKTENAERLKLALELAAGLHSQGEIAYDKSVYDPKFFQAPQKTAATYRESAAELSRTESRLISGEVNLSGLRPGSGSYASDEVASQRSKTRARLIAKAIAARITATLCRWHAVLNWGASAPHARLTAEIAGDDQTALQAGLKLADEFGRPIGEHHMERATGVPAPAYGERTYNRGGNGNDA